MQNIAFIGLGHMGQPMAKNLLNANYKLIAYDVIPQALAALTTAGAEAATSVTEAVQKADVVITMLQSSEQVADVCLQPDGIFAAAKKNLLYIDCSSIDIAVTKKLHARAGIKSIAMLDAPVSGGVVGATNASLTFMVGGLEKDFLRAKPILDSMGKKIIHAGDAGAGQAAKICNNLLLAISMIGVSEAFSLAKKLGLDEKKFFDISSNASGQCWAMTNYCPVPDVIPNVPANHDYQAGFMTKMMLKDLRLAQHAAENVNAVLPLGSLATQLYALFNGRGFGEMDFSGIIKMIAADTNSG